MVDNNMTTTDAGAWIYYKLTYKPLAQMSQLIGSVEPIKKSRKVGMVAL